VDLKELELRKVRYLEKFDCQWDWFGSLSVPRGLSRRYAIRRLEDWLDDLRREEGGKRFRWVRLFKHGVGGEPDQFHILVGGLRGRTRTWERRWSKRNLSSRLQHFNEHHREAIRTIVDSMDSDGHLDIDYDIR
jgi:hypothetical protein